jgi:hypothetical protein
MPRGCAWQAARKGDTFVIGSAVRTGAASRAKLRVGKGGKLEVRPSSIVYFTRDGKKQRDDVRVETGGVEIETGDESVGLGEAVVEPGAKVRVARSAADGATTIVVTLGRVVLEDNVIEAGKSITLGGKPAAPSPKPCESRRSSGTVTIAGITVHDLTGTGGAPRSASTVESGSTIATPSDRSRRPSRAVQHRSTAGPSEVRIRSPAISGAGDRAATADAVATIPGGSVSAPRWWRATASAASSRHAGAPASEAPSDRDRERHRAAAPGGDGDGRRAARSSARPPPPATVATIDAGESPTIHDARRRPQCDGARCRVPAPGRSRSRRIARSSASSRVRRRRRRERARARRHAQHRVRCP